jgi:hypothetical protein
VHIQKERHTQSDKLGDRAEVGILVGYEGDNIYRVYVPSRRGNKIVRSSTVTFNENNQYEKEIEVGPAGLYEPEEVDGVNAVNLEHGGVQNETCGQGEAIDNVNGPVNGPANGLGNGLGDGPSDGPSDGPGDGPSDGPGLQIDDPKPSVDE